MSKKLAAIHLATSIASTAIVLTPMGGAMAASPVMKVAMSKAKISKAVECPREADAKGLRGKMRKKFLAECKMIASRMS